MFVINFYSHAPCGARPNVRPRGIVVEVFLLTRPLRGATARASGAAGTNEFLLTRPLRGATVVFPMLFITAEHFYSHAPCGARPWCFQCFLLLQSISTHTPLAGRDGAAFRRLDDVENFYSHAPCGARPVDNDYFAWTSISTHTPLAGRDADFPALISSE